MKSFLYPEREEWDKILARPSMSNESLEAIVSPVLSAVKTRGDAALREFTKKFDQVELDVFRVNENEIKAAEALLSTKLKNAILQATENIKRFHEAQKEDVVHISTMEGVECWRKSVAVERVGIYVPGGTAPLFSTVLMLAIPAKLAGCSEIVLCSPPDKEGKLHPAILYCANLSGITKIFKVGGAQAIAAMAFGTETVPRVYKIFGPGNQYVTAAKEMVSKAGVAIDMPAGPSEVAVFADASANADFVAADLLSQAEHGVDSQVVLVTTAQGMIEKVDNAIQNQLPLLPRKAIAEKALANSRAVLVKNSEEAVDLLNAYAPEHLILSVHDPEIVAEKIVNAGSVFLGHFTPESVGDYASGTNHTLPTNGWAKTFSGVSLDSFFKKITFQKLSKRGLQNIGQTVEEMAKAEGLEGHKQAVSLRLAWLKANDRP